MRTHRKTFPPLVLAALLLGCSRAGLPTLGSLAEATSTPTVEPSKASVAPTATAEPLVLVDALGREVLFAEPPERIAIAGRATALLAHSVYMFPEADERLVTLEDRVQRDLSFYPMVDGSFDQKSLLERDAGPEQIAPFDPDVVLLKSYLAESLGDPLERLGIPFITLDLETPDQFQRDIRLLGLLLGNETRAETILNYYESRVAMVAEHLDDVGPRERPSVLLLQYSDRGGEVAFNVPSVHWLQTHLVQEAGGDPVWLDAAQGGGWTVIGFEQVAAWDPDKIIVINYRSDPAPVLEGLRVDPNWSALSAVQDGQLHGFPGDYLSWDQPDPRWILGLIWLAKTLHPDQTEAIDLAQEISLFYQEMYGLDPETIEVEILPRLTEALR